uniref:Uncharacterized protein n=1 Tax=Arundo donax TaxID=35708 RepID=A0A0A9A4P4_ARUDO
MVTMLISCHQGVPRGTQEVMKGTLYKGIHARHQEDTEWIVKYDVLLP